MEMEYKVWIVVNIESGCTYGTGYSNLEDARDAAKKLALKNERTTTFFVFESVEAYRKESLVRNVRIGIEPVCERAKEDG